MQLLHKKIWKSLAASKAAGPTMAAVAYVNKDYLQLKEGDTLICDASDGRVATGATSAKVLIKLLKRRVRLFHLPSLHAKVVRMPHQVLLGSANMTSNSDKLEEASVLSAEPALLRQVDDYFKGLKKNNKLRPIGVRFLNRISKIKVILGGGSTNKASSADAVAGPRVWIAGIKDLSDRATLKTYKDVEMGTGVDFTDQPFYRIGVRHKVPLPQRGDFIVQVHRESKVAMRPACVKSVCETATHVIFFFKPEDEETTITWKRVSDVLKDEGVFNRSGIPMMLPLDSGIAARVKKMYGYVTSR